MKRPRKAKVTQVAISADDMAMVTKDGKLLHRTKAMPLGKVEDITPDLPAKPKVRRRRKRG